VVPEVFQKEDAETIAYQFNTIVQITKGRREHLCIEFSSKSNFNHEKAKNKFSNKKNKTQKQTLANCTTFRFSPVGLHPNTQICEHGWRWLPNRQFGQLVEKSIV